MANKLHEFISQIPKSDLHVHLDGSVHTDTLIELSKKQKLFLPSYTTEGLNKLVFKEQYKNLVEYLQGFALVLPVMQTQENLERISYEFAQDNIKEGVCYIEVRFAPQLHVNENENFEQVLTSVNRGLQRAKLEYNKSPEVKAKKFPEFNYGIIACALRYFGKGFSRYYDLFLDAHQHLNFNSMVAMSSFELAQACVKIRDRLDIPIVALDIAGAEAGNPPIYHHQAYHFAHQNFMHTTVHAGEAFGPESIFQAIATLYPERIGHGFHLFSRDKITDIKIKDKKEYLEKLIQYIADRRITLEVCLTSNLQTIPALKTIKNHPFAKMQDEYLSVVLCTDNRTISKTSVTKEILLAIQNFNLNQDSLKSIIVNGFKKSFYPGTYKEKLSYLQQVLIRYDNLTKQYSDLFL